MLKRADGYSLIEVLSVIGIMGVLLSAGLPHFDTRREDINTAMRQFVGEFRVARTQAITSGVHFSLDLSTPGTLAVQRHLEAPDSTWPVETVTKRITLPAHLSSWMYPTAIEFNTRGTMVTSASPVYVYVSDSIGSTAHAFSVWPSGQVNEEY